MAYLLAVSLKHFILLISISSSSVSCNIQAEKNRVRSGAKMFR